MVQRAARATDKIASAMKLHLGASVEASSFADLIYAMPDREFQRVTRSTLALLAWWKVPERVEALTDCLGWAMTAQATARFESPEPAGCSTCKGRGKASFTDVMLDLGADVVAIEAKRNERLYKTAKSWLARNPASNRQAVLAHWLRCCLGLDGSVERYQDLVYQMIHRTASARRAARSRRAHVVHLLLGNDHVDEYVEASARAAELLAPNGEPHFHVIVVPTNEGRTYNDVVAALEGDCGADHVREALLMDDTIFTFGQPSIR